MRLYVWTGTAEQNVWLPSCRFESLFMSDFTSQRHRAWSRLRDKRQRTFKQSSIRLRWNKSRFELQTVVAVNSVIWQKAECSLAWQIRCLTFWAMVHISHRGRGYGVLEYRNVFYSHGWLSLSLSVLIHPEFLLRTVVTAAWCDGTDSDASAILMTTCIWSALGHAAPLHSLSVFSKQPHLKRVLLLRGCGWH